MRRSCTWWLTAGPGARIRRPAETQASGPCRGRTGVDRRLLVLCVLTQVTGSLGELRQRPSGLPLLSGRGGKGGDGPGKRNLSVARRAPKGRRGEDDDEKEGRDDDDGQVR